MTVQHIDFVGDRNPSNTALIVIDVQCAFTESSLFGISSAQSVLDNINSAVDQARSLEIPIIWVRYQVRSEVGLGLTSRRYGVEDLHTGPGTELDSRLHVLPNDEVIIKPRQSAFYNTDLEYLLRMRQIKYALIAGVTTNVCVLAAVKDASERDFGVTLLEDCTAALPILRDGEEVMTAAEVQEATVNFVRWAYGPAESHEIVFNQIRSNIDQKTQINAESRSALAIIDLQNTFTQESSPLGVVQANLLIEQTNSLAKKARGKGVPVIWIKREDRGSVGPGITASRYGRTGIHREDGAQFDTRLDIQPTDLTLTKRRQSSFYSSDLEVVLRGLAVTKLFLAGVTTNVCVLGTAKDASERDLEVYVIADLTAALPVTVQGEQSMTAVETQSAALNFIAWAYGTLVNSKDIFN
jgi:ureidoacrylate peracid hydrolase